jgi:hypothetical protein
MKTAIFLMALVWLGSGIGAMIAQAKFINLLRLKHSSEWELLERPRLFGSSIRPQYLLLKFLLLGEYLKLGDAEINRSAKAATFYGIAYISAFSLALVLGLKILQ